MTFEQIKILHELHILTRSLDKFFKKMRESAMTPRATRMRRCFLFFSRGREGEEKDNRVTRLDFRLCRSDVPFLSGPK